MSFIKSLYSIILEAVFPVARAEKEVLSYPPEAAWKILPRPAVRPVALCSSLWSYKDERVSRLVWSLKYRKSRTAAAIGGYALFRILSIYSAVVDAVIVVPMPITKRRRRERGFNQCELLTAEIAKLARSKRINQGGLVMAEDLLMRQRHASRQTLKDRENRLESAAAKDIFAVNERAAGRFSSLRQENIGGGQASTCRYLMIVIDDVVTTGGTMTAAVNALRAAGFLLAFGLSIAH